MKALLLVDLQNDYFEGGKFPLWNSEKTLESIKDAISMAKEKNIPIVHIKHVADPSLGIAPFFNEGTVGVEIHNEVLAATPDSKIVIKAYADGFYKTDLEAVLKEIGATELLFAGMMTQNCVTHTAISKSAEKYKVKILGDCCTSVSEPIHLIGLHAVSTRIPITSYKEELK